MKKHRFLKEIDKQLLHFIKSKKEKKEEEGKKEKEMEEMEEEISKPIVRKIMDGYKSPYRKSRMSLTKLIKTGPRGRKRGRRIIRVRNRLSVRGGSCMGMDKERRRKSVRRKSTFNLPAKRETINVVNIVSIDDGDDLLLGNESERKKRDMDLLRLSYRSLPETKFKEKETKDVQKKEEVDVDDEKKFNISNFRRFSEGIKVCIERKVKKVKVSDEFLSLLKEKDEIDLVYDLIIKHLEEYLKNHQEEEQQQQQQPVVMLFCEKLQSYQENSRQAIKFTHQTCSRLFFLESFINSYQLTQLIRNNCSKSTQIDFNEFYLIYYDDYLKAFLPTYVELPYQKKLNVFSKRKLFSAENKTELKKLLDDDDEEEKLRILNGDIVVKKMERKFEYKVKSFKEFEKLLKGDYFDDLIVYHLLIRIEDKNNQYEYIKFTEVMFKGLNGKDYLHLCVKGGMRRNYVVLKSNVNTKQRILLAPKCFFKEYINKKEKNSSSIATFKVNNLVYFSMNYYTSFGDETKSYVEHLMKMFSVIQSKFDLKKMLNVIKKFKNTSNIKNFISMSLLCLMNLSLSSKCKFYDVENSRKRLKYEMVEKRPVKGLKGEIVKIMKRMKHSKPKKIKPMIKFGISNNVIRIPISYGDDQKIFHLIELFYYCPEVDLWFIGQFRNEIIKLFAQIYSKYSINYLLTESKKFLLYRIRSIFIICKDKNNGNDQEKSVVRKCLKNYPLFFKDRLICELQVYSSTNEEVCSNDLNVVSNVVKAFENAYKRFNEGKFTNKKTISSVKRCFFQSLFQILKKKLILTLENNTLKDLKFEKFDLLNPLCTFIKISERVKWRKYTWLKKKRLLIHYVKNHKLKNEIRIEEIHTAISKIVTKNLSTEQSDVYEFLNFCIYQSCL